MAPREPDTPRIAASAALNDSQEHEAIDVDLFAGRFFKPIVVRAIVLATARSSIRFKRR